MGGYEIILFKEMTNKEIRHGDGNKSESIDFTITTFFSLIVYILVVKADGYRLRLRFIVRGRCHR